MEKTEPMSQEEQLMCERREMQNDLILALKDITLEMMEEYRNDMDDHDTLTQIRKNIAIIMRF